MARYFLLALLIPTLFVCRGADADRGLSDIWDNGQVTGGSPIFPNWDMVWVGSFDILLWDTNDGPEIINGITVANFGTAGDSDIENIYWIITGDGATCKGTGLQTMTYAGIYNVLDQAAEQLPAWTWQGTAADVSMCSDPGGGTVVTIDLFADISPCPAEGATVKLGFPVNYGGSTTYYGSITDFHTDWDLGTNIPLANTTGQLGFPILYVYKVADKEAAAPADTVSYTVYYGRPGVGNLSSITIIDSLPLYMHYVLGSASPAADSGWAPNSGQRLRWTLPGPIPTVGGSTNQVVFQATIDWGNGEAFEPGSGDLPAPEGERIRNLASAFFEGAACPWGTSPPVTTVVRRFLYWMLGSNDLLFSSSIGFNPDEVIYSIYVKNLSSKKSWYSISIWDTVPPELDVWCADCGLDDPFLGWTMTPTGAAQGSPQVTVSLGRTILDWHLDMAPSKTLELRWKAKVKPSASAGTYAINQVSLLSFGRPKTLDGTGGSVVTKRFTHLAPICLTTTYISYVAYATEYDDNSPGFLIDFFPLNQRTQFQLYGIQYDGTRNFVLQGGVSQSIGCQIGDCVGGFPGNAGCVLGSGGIPGGGISGCGAERIPAVYNPVWTPPIMPFNFIYKVVSNSPVVWQLLTHVVNCNQDRHTYAPSTTITYRGWMHYTWPADYTNGTSFTFINTGMGPYMNHNPDQPTTVHLFKGTYGPFSWNYVRTIELGPEAATGMMLQGPDTYPPTSPDYAPWRMISSDTALLIDIGSYEYHTAGCCCCSGADNHAAFEPTRETGLTVTPVDSNGNPMPANLYGLTNDLGCGAGESVCVVGNVGKVTATYDVWAYTPLNVMGDARIPPLLRNSEGLWRKIGTYTVPPGGDAPGNPVVHAPAPFKFGGTGLHRISLLSGGPIQVNTGSDVFAGWGGGGVIHAANGKTMGSEFWLHAPYGRMPGGGKGCTRATHSVDILVPKANVLVTATEESLKYYKASYTTTGPDQAVKFIALSRPADGSRYNWVFKTDGADAIALYNQCTQTEKGFTAPFLETGVHYEIVAPPVVFVGQKFWLTVVVLGGGNVTEIDYCGTSGFTSSDPLAQIEGLPMGGYTYPWKADPPSFCDNPIGVNDNGVKVFVNVSMGRTGNQTIVVNDTADGSIVGLGAVFVVAADVKLTKHPSSVQASGDIVQFRICWSNYSEATVSGFTITDRMPNGFTYLTDPPQAPADLLCGGTYGNPTGVTVAYSITDNSPGSFSQMSGAIGGPPLPAWLRWTIPEVIPNTTGCVCFKAKVN